MGIVRRWVQTRRDRHDARVLTVLLMAGEPMRGWPLTRAAQLSAPATFSALERLRADSLAEATWETFNDGCRRRLYRLTDAGRERAHELFASAEKRARDPRAGR